MCFLHSVRLCRLQRQYQTVFFNSRCYHETILDLGKKVLVVGDGNLSYSASVSMTLAQEGTHLTATVLESQEEHHRVYEHSMDHVQQIRACGHDVCFQVDATSLETYWPGQEFDLIQFNFPHIQGKTNARYNRLLLQAFFRSSTQVLKRDGHVHVALMSHQGGAFARNMEEWKQSWMPAKYATNHGLLLTCVEPFEPSYQLSSYRGKDKSFGIRGEPQLYVFAAPQATDCLAEQDVQLFWHFNVYLHHDDKVHAVVSNEKKIQHRRLQEHVQNVLPQGWRGQVFFVKVIPSKTSGWITVYKICFYGESRPICQAEADRCRVLVQDTMVADALSLLLRRHWVISNPYPSSILQTILQADRAR